MGFILKYVQKTKSGYRYRRRWPQAVREVLDCGEYFFEMLGKTEDDVVRSYAKAERNFKYKIAAASSKSDLQAEIKEDQKTALQLHKVVAERIRKAGFDPYNTSVEIDLDDPSLGFDPNTNSFLRELPPALREAESRGLLADEVLNKYIPWQLDGSEEAKYLAMDIPQSELDFIRGLANGMPKMPSPTIEDARREYLAHKGYHSPKEKKNLDRINDVVSAAKEALGGDFRLGEISTKDARKILTHIKESRGIKFSTLKRYYNDLRAMINFTLRELDCDDIVNRFEGITIPKDSIAKEEREPFTEDEIIAIATQIKNRSNGNTLSLIWSLLNGTGCRLDEIASLRTGDVFLAHTVPHLRIEGHELRRLKTKSSVRSIPLVGNTLEVAGIAVREAGDSDKLFSRYFDKADNASSALMKYVRAITQNEKKVVHSLRHTMKDRLVLAGVSQQIQNMILGHSSGNVSGVYGGQAASLEASRKGLIKALEKASF